MDNQPRKVLLVKVAVTIIAGLILVIWALNLRNVWRQGNPAPASSDQESWTKLQTDLNKTMADIKDQLSQLNQANQASSSSSSTNFLVNVVKNTQEASSSPAATASPVEIPAASAPVAASTTPFLGKQDACPKYINCMPSVGGPAHACQIPAGCEGATTLVY